MKPPVLLCYNLQGEKASKIKLLAMRLMIRMRPVNAEEYGQTLAALCDYEQLAELSSDIEPFTDEMLVLGNFSTDLINQFLIGFRQSMIPVVNLKAILTETNMVWNSVTLHSQLTEEHEALTNSRAPQHTPEDP